MRAPTILGHACRRCGAVEVGSGDFSQGYYDISDQAFVLTLCNNKVGDLTMDLTGIGTTVVGIGGKIIDKIFPGPEEKAKAKALLIELEQSGELEELKTRMSAIIAEAKSADPWTSRARPSFMYVIYLMILAAIPMGVLSAFSPEKAVLVAEGMKAWLGAIPDGLWVTFGVGYTGYSVARSVDKKNLVGRG